MTFGDAILDISPPSCASTFAVVELGVLAATSGQLRMGLPNGARSQALMRVGPSQPLFE